MNLDEDSHVPEDLRLMFKILRNAGIEDLRHRLGFAPYPFLRSVIKRTLEAADIEVHDLIHPAILSLPNIAVAAP
jgi:hypothetical protein